MIIDAFVLNPKKGSGAWGSLGDARGAREVGQGPLRCLSVFEMACYERKRALDDEHHVRRQRCRGDGNMSQVLRLRLHFRPLPNLSPPS